jgi:nucleoside-diphosphate-sugar epimerase
MKAAVTGGTGFLGRQLVSRLLEKGLEVRCLVRPTSDLGALGGERDALASGRLEVSVANFQSADAIARLLADCEVVFHLASTLTGSTAVMFASNVVVTRRLIEAALRVNLTRFVHVSSLGVYDTRYLGRNGVLDEDCPLDPEPHRRDPYTYSKIAQENVIRELTTDRDFPLVIIRPGVIYGPGRDCLSNRVGLRFGNLLIQVCGRRCVPYTHAKNCAEAIFLAGITPGIDGQILNIIDDDLPTASALVKRYRREAAAIRRLPLPRPAVYWLSSVCQWYHGWSGGQLPAVLTPYKSRAQWSTLRYPNSKAAALLGWRPQVGFPEGLGETLAWLRQNRGRDSGSMVAAATKNEKNPSSCEFSEPVTAVS